MNILGLHDLTLKLKNKQWMLVLLFIFFIQAAIVFEAYAADTTIKGTTVTDSTASLEVTNSANATLLYVRNDGNVGIGTATPSTALEVDGTISGTTIVGANVTSGTDPGHTHTAYHGYVDRGDPASDDWNKNDVTMDSTWRELDCISIVPAGAVAINFHVRIKHGSASQYFGLRKNGNSNGIATMSQVTQVANVWVQFNGVVACDSESKVEYICYAGMTGLAIRILGWWI